MQKTKINKTGTKYNVAKIMTTPLENLDDGSKRFIQRFYFCRYGNTTTSRYMIKVLNGSKSKQLWETKTWKDSNGKNWPTYGKLFHANSVATAVNFIRKGGLFSRQYGENNKLQTPQKSDDLDKRLNIYNDIFFDNSDIVYHAPYKTSAYGPVMFVFNPCSISEKEVRITKVNPAGTGSKKGMTYDDLFFASTEELSQAIKDEKKRGFINNWGHHTTIYNEEMLEFTNDNLFAIYIERKADKSGKEKDVKALLEKELKKQHLNVPVIIRPFYPVIPKDKHLYAAEIEELWEFPKAAKKLLII